MYISVLVVATGLSLHYLAATLIVWVGTLAMPFFLYRMLRRSLVATTGNLSFAELWAEGIATFLLGSLIPALVAYAGIRFCMPDFLHQTLQHAIQSLGEQDAGNSAMLIDIFEQQLKMPAPSAVDVASQLISFNIVIGTILSMLVAIFVKVAMPRRSFKQKNLTE
jgi:hypothetical protein